MIGWLRKHLWRRRLRSLQIYLVTHPINPSETGKVAERLTTVWRRLRLTEVGHFDPTVAAITELSVWTTRLPELLDRLKQFNQWIREDREVQVERMTYELTTQYTVSLDFYLTDANGCHLDLTASLLQLRSLVHEHYLLVKHQETHFYQRQATKLYQDIRELTVALVIHSLPPQ